MARFSVQAWDDTARLRRAIHDLPFNRELAAGTLGRERFRFYIEQDAVYLDGFARTLTLAAARAPDTTLLEHFANAALVAIVVERALHERRLQSSASDSGETARTEPAPDCFAYTSFLMATAYHQPWEVLLAALLPCFRLYWDVGSAIAATAAPDNPYRDWIDTYADKKFGNAVSALIAIVDQAAAPLRTSPHTREQMLAAHRRATQYEYLFWDGAYNRRGWPLSATRA